MLATLTRWWGRSWFCRINQIVLGVYPAVETWGKILTFLLGAPALAVDNPNCPGDVVAGAFAQPCEEIRVEDVQARPFATADYWGHLFVLSNAYTWPPGVDGTGSGGAHQDLEDLERKVTEHLETPGLQNQMKIATDVVAVGVASCEGDRGTEVERAGKRAETLAKWLNETAPEEKIPSIWELNLGRWKEGCPEDGEVSATAHQRPILFIAIQRSDCTENLDPFALLEALEKEGQSVGSLRPSHYNVPRKALTRKKMCPQSSRRR